MTSYCFPIYQATSEKVFFSKGKGFSRLGSEIFPFRVDPFPQSSQTILRVIFPENVIIPHKYFKLNKLSHSIY